MRVTKLHNFISVVMFMLGILTKILRVPAQGRGSL